MFEVSLKLKVTVVQCKSYHLLILNTGIRNCYMHFTDVNQQSVDRIFEISLDAV